MDIRNKIFNDCKQNLELYDYYKSIGCTDNQSLVLSLYTYGNKGYSWRNCSEAFDYFIDKYDSEKDGVFADYIVKLILKVIEQDNKVSLISALENTDEYKKYLEECRIVDERNRKENTGILFNFGNSNVKKNKGIMASMVGIAPKESQFMRSTGLTNVVNSSFAVTEHEDSFCCLSESYEDSIDEEVGNFTTLDCIASNSVSVVEKVTEVVQKDLMEKISTDRYETIEEKGFLSPLTSPTSTFRMTSNTAAFGLLRHNISHGRDAKESMVRIEELLNNFEYKLSKPTNRMFNINTQICNKPNSKNKLLFVGVQGKDIIPQRQNITLLLDTSGSMSVNNVWTQATMVTIVKQLKENDILSLVTYSDTDHIVIKNMKIDDKSIDEFIYLLYSIIISGCTWGSKGIETAYELANNTYIEDGINRVILMTDGDLNFGITDKGGLKDLILSKKDNGIFLSVLGTGLYNYKDDNLETLSKNGNGNYYTIDCIEDIKENIYDKYNSLVFTIAKDVKAQVEFNPKFVKSYRLIGYENRALNHEDFRNDAVISEPFGCGSYGVALYELEMQDGTTEIKSDLKYQQPILTDADSICTVSVRYKEPLATESQELSVEVKNKTVEIKDNLLLAYVVSVIGEKLRNSEYLDKDEDKFVLDILYKNGLGDLYEKNSEKFKTLLSFVEK